MNKKIVIAIILIIVLALIGGLVYLIKSDVFGKNANDNVKAVGTSISAKTNDQNEEANLNGENSENNKENKVLRSPKILIAYFSRADENYNVGTVEVGNTEVMAGFIRDYFDGNVDTFKIDPVKSYPKNYQECTEVATEELRSGARPEFKDPDILDINNYDLVFIGYPIWWGNVPMIVNTFLEKYDFTGKTIIPFCTHEGSEEAGTFTYLKNKMDESNVNTNGLAIQGKIARQESSRSTVESWLKELGY